MGEMHRARAPWAAMGGAVAASMGLALIAELGSESAPAAMAGPPAAFATLLPGGPLAPETSPGPFDAEPHAPAGPTAPEATQAAPASPAAARAEPTTPAVGNAERDAPAADAAHDRSAGGQSAASAERRPGASAPSAAGANPGASVALPFAPPARVAAPPRAAAKPAAPISATGAASPAPRFDVWREPSRPGAARGGRGEDDVLLALCRNARDSECARWMTRRRRPQTGGR